MVQLVSLPFFFLSHRHNLKKFFLPIWKNLFKCPIQFRNPNCPQFFLSTCPYLWATSVCVYIYAHQAVWAYGLYGRPGISLKTHLQPLVECTVSCAECILWTGVRISVGLCCSLSWRDSAEGRMTVVAGGCGEGGWGALEPGRPTNNASRQAGCNLSPPSGPGVACHSTLPLSPLCTPKMLLKRFGQRENSSSKELSSC